LLSFRRLRILYAQEGVRVEADRIAQIKFAYGDQQAAISPLQDWMALNVFYDELAGDVRDGRLLLEGGDGPIMDAAAMIEKM
jgi:hypothetical protein